MMPPDLSPYANNNNTGYITQASDRRTTRRPRRSSLWSGRNARERTLPKVRGGEKSGLAIVALSAAAYFIPVRFFGQPLADYSAADNSAMIGLNALSAATLVVFIGLLSSGAVATSEGRGDQAPQKK